MRRFWQIVIALAGAASIGADFYFDDHPEKLANLEEQHPWLHPDHPWLLVVGGCALALAMFIALLSQRKRNKEQSE